MKEKIRHFFDNFSLFGFLVKLFVFYWIIFELVPFLTSTVKLKSDIFYIEYGTSVPGVVTYYAEEDRYVIRDAVVSFEEPEEGYVGEYVGEYKGKILYRDKEYPFTVVVQDTIGPKMNMLKDEYFIEQFATEIEYKRFFYIKDESELTVTADTSSIDINKPGIYDVTVKASDVYGNESEKVVKFTVLSTADSNNFTLSSYYDGIRPKRPGK